MKYNDILQSKNECEKAVTEFFSLACDFYLNVTKKITTDLDLPDGTLIKLHKEQDINCNVIDDCVSISDGKAVYRIILVVKNDNHGIKFTFSKLNINEVGLVVLVNDIKQTFNFDLIHKSAIANLKLEEVFNFISQAIIDVYSKGEKAHNVFND